MNTRQQKISSSLSFSVMGAHKKAAICKPERGLPRI